MEKSGSAENMRRSETLYAGTNTCGGVSDDIAMNKRAHSASNFGCVLV